jgi:hypothetical protein
VRDGGILVHERVRLVVLQLRRVWLAVRGVATTDGPTNGHENVLAKISVGPERGSPFERRVNRLLATVSNSLQFYKTRTSGNELTVAKDRCERSGV